MKRLAVLIVFAASVASCTWIYSKQPDVVRVSSPDQMTIEILDSVVACDSDSTIRVAFRLVNKTERPLTVPLYCLLSLRFDAVSEYTAHPTYIALSDSGPLVELQGGLELDTAAYLKCLPECWQYSGDSVSLWLRVDWEPQPEQRFEYFVLSNNAAVLGK